MPGCSSAGQAWGAPREEDAELRGIRCAPPRASRHADVARLDVRGHGRVLMVRLKLQLRTWHQELMHEASQGIILMCHTSSYLTRPSLQGITTGHTASIVCNGACRLVVGATCNHMKYILNLHHRV